MKKLVLILAATGCFTAVPIAAQLPRACVMSPTITSLARLRSCVDTVDARRKRDSVNFELRLRAVEARLTPTPVPHPPPAPPPPPPPPSTALWSTPTQLGIQHFTASCGSNVYSVGGNGALSFYKSTDEGVTFTFVPNMGPGVVYLDRPIVCEGNSVAFLSVEITQTIVDFAGPRSVGDIFLHYSSDAAATWIKRRVTTGATALRIGVGIFGSTAHVTWMNWRPVTGSNVGIWDINYSVSRDGAAWQQKVLATGAGRPSIAVVGNAVHIVAMGDIPSKGDCPIEGNYILRPCTEVLYMRSTDGGSTFSNRFLTSVTARYSGRPDIAAAGTNVIVAYDTKMPTGKNDLGVMQSSDGGQTFGAEYTLASAAENQTHAYLGVGSNPSKVYVAWSDNRTGFNTVIGRASNDGGKTYGPEENIGRGESPVTSVSGNYILVTFASPGYGPILLSRRLVQ